MSVLKMYPSKICSRTFSVRLNQIVVLMFLHLISGCVEGQYVYEDQCMACPVGTYQDSIFHMETMCKNCSGTEPIFVK